MEEKDWKKVISELEQLAKDDPNFMSKIIKEVQEKEYNCSLKGHPGSKIIGIEQGIRADCTCPTCGVWYNRPLTDEERKEWYKQTQEPYMVRA